MIFMALSFLRLIHGYFLYEEVISVRLHEKDKIMVTKRDSSHFPEKTRGLFYLFMHSLTDFLNFIDRYWVMFFCYNCNNSSSGSWWSHITCVTFWNSLKASSSNPFLGWIINSSILEQNLTTWQNLFHYHLPIVLETTFLF